MKPLDLTGLEDGPQAAGLNLEALDEPTSNKVGDGVAAAASGQFVPARFAAAVNPETPYPGVDRFGSQIGPARSLGTLGEAGRMLRESLPATMVLGRSENQRLQDLQAQGSAGLNPPALDYRGQRTDQAGNLLPSVAKPVEVTEDTGALPSLARGVVGLGKIGVGLGLQAQDIAGIKGGPLPGWAADLKAITDEMQPEVGEFKNIGRGFTADERGALARRGAAYLQEAVMENLPMMVPSLVSGALALVFGRNLIKAAAARAMEAAAADSAAREALNHAARNLGVQAAEKHFIKAAGKAAAERATLAAQVAGATAGSVALESGNIYADMAEEGHRGRTQALVAAGAAVPAGVLDTLGEVMALRRLQGAPLGSAVARLAEKALGKPMVERGVVKLGVAGVEQFIAEAPTEFLQEAIEQAAKVSQDPAAQGAFWSKWWDTAPQWREAGIKGGLGGLGIGVGSGAIGAVVTGRGGESSKVKDQQSMVAVETEAPAVEGVDYLPDAGGVDPVEELVGEAQSSKLKAQTEIVPGPDYQPMEGQPFETDEPLPLPPQPAEGERQKAKGKSEVVPGPDYQPLEGQPFETDEPLPPVTEPSPPVVVPGVVPGTGLDLSGLEPDEWALDYGDGGTLPEVQPWPKLPEVGAVPGQEKPWQMTREEWDARLTPAARKVFGVANGGFQHRQFVLDAAINGLPIPERVRAQYPDLNERVDEWRREQAKAAEQRKEIERRAAEEGKRKQEAAQRQREAEAKRRQEEEGYRAQRMATRHTRTLKEYLSGHSPRRHPGKLLAAEHRAAVEEALRQGKAVPAGVLADYPDLVIPEPPTGGRNTGVQGQDVAPAATPGGDRTAPAAANASPAYISPQEIQERFASESERAAAKQSETVAKMVAEEEAWRNRPRKQTGEELQKEWEAQQKAKKPAKEPAPAPPAVAAEVRKAEVVKEKQAVAPLAAKAQKKFLLEEIDKALAEAPDVEVTPYPVQGWERGERRDELEKQYAAALAEDKARVGTVTIEVPGDGTFEILNTRKALQAFKAKAAKFPTTVPKKAEPGKVRETPTAAPVVGKLEPGAALKAARLVVSEDTDSSREVIAHVWSDGQQSVATDGRRMMIVQAGSGGTAKAPVLVREDGKTEPAKDRGKNAKGEEKRDFPDWRAVVPKESIERGKGLDTGRLWTVLKQALAVWIGHKEPQHSVTLVHNRDGSIGLMTSAPEAGEYVHNVQPGWQSIVAVNGEYLADGLAGARMVGNEKVTISWTDEMAPVVIDGKGFKYVVMPLRLNGGRIAEVAKQKAERVAKMEELSGAARGEGKRQKAKGESEEGAAAEEGTRQKAKGERQKETPEADSGKIEDFGAKLGGARKDKWKARGLNVADFDGLTDTEKQSYAEKSQVFPPLDFAGKIAGGMPRELAWRIKRIYDAILPKPVLSAAEQRDATARTAALRRYVDLVGQLRDGLAGVKTQADLTALAMKMFPHGSFTPEQRSVAQAISKVSGRRYSLVVELADNSAWAEQHRARDLEAWPSWPEPREKWERLFEIRETPAGTKVRDKAGEWRLTESVEWRVVKKVSRSSYQVVSVGHKTEEEAKAAARAMAEASGGEQLTRPLNPNARRSGPDYRKGRDVEGQEILDTFGFRGGEFGNWTNAADRQQSLNQAFDALHDLARTLNIEPRAVGLNGELGIAFGARGSGRASAHYEPGTVVINLTRTRGEGALAHEWAHALDDYFGRLSSGGQSRLFRSENPKAAGGFRAELADKLAGVMAAITKRGWTRPEFEADVRSAHASAKDQAGKWVAAVERATQKVGLTADQKASADGLRDVLLGVRMPAATEAGRPDLKTVAGDWLSLFSAAARQQGVKIDWPVGSRKESDVASALGWAAGRLHASTDQIARLEAGTLEMVNRTVPTDLLKASEEQGEYWERRHELFARVFEAYVEDTLRGEGFESPYLVQATAGSGVWGNLYPQGDERAATNAAVREFVAQIRTLREGDKIDAKLTEWIEKLKLKPGALYEGVTGLPVWLSQEAAHAALVVVRAAYRAGKHLAEAVREGVVWLEQQGLRGFNDGEATAWLAASLGEEPMREHAIKQLHAGNRNAAVQAAILAASTREVRSDDEVDAAVAGIIREAGGAEAALPVVNDVRLPLDTRYALALAVANQLNDEVMQLTGQQPAGWLAESNRLAQLVGKFLGEFIPTTTETARGLRQLARLKAMGRQTPIGWDAFARTTIENVNAEQRARLAPVIQSLIEELNRLNAEVSRATAETKAVQDAARQAAEAAVRAEAERQGSEIRNAMVIETTNSIELLPSVRKAKAAATVKALQKLGGAGYWQGLVNKGQAALVKAIEQALNGAGARVNAVTVAEIAQLMTRVLRQQVDATLGTEAQKRQGLPALMKLRVLFGANERMSDFWRGVRGQLANELTEKYGERPEIEALLGQTMDVWSGPLVRAAMKEVLAEQETNLGGVIREHLRGVGTGSIEAARATLAAKIVEAVGLDEQTGERLARAVEAEFDAEMRKQQGKVAERLRKAEENRRKAAAAVPRRRAEAIVRQFAKSQSDTLSWMGPKVTDAIREAVTEQVRDGALTDEAFAAKLEGLGVPADVAETLAATTQRERTIRQAIEAEDARQTEAEAPTKRAGQIVRKFAVSQSDTLAWSQQTEDVVGAAVQRQLAADVGKGQPVATEAEFAAELEGLGVKPDGAATLAAVVMRERTVREATRKARAAEAQAKREAAAPTKAAERIVATLAKSQSDTQSWQKAKQGAVQRLVQHQISKRAWTDAVFRKLLERLGVKPAAAGTLTQVVAREIEVRNRLAQELMFGEDAIDKAIRKALTATGQQLGRIVRTHHSEQAGVGKALAERLVAEAGLSGPAAERLAAAVLGRFKQLAEQRKRRIVEQMTKPRTARELRKRSVADRIIEASNLGALDAETTWQALAEKLGLAVYTPEHSAEVRRRAELLQRLPVGSVQRIQATARLLAFIAKAHGVKASELAWAVWYANTLSGPMTHLVNSVSNLASLGSGTVAAMRGNPLALPRVFGALLHGFRVGGLEAGAVLRYGSEAKRAKFDTHQHALELLGPEAFTGARLVAGLKYVGRALAAADALFYFPAREVKTVQLAHALARGEGLRGAELARRRDEVMNGTDAQEADWRSQIGREAAGVEAAGMPADRLWRARRLQQLREENRPGAMVESADDFALKLTFNNQPTGLMGLVSGWATQATRQLPAARLVVPFINIVGNVVNESLNYTPWGFARGAAAGRNGVPSVLATFNEAARRGSVPVTPDAVIDLHAKAALGTLLFAGLALAAAAGGGGDDDGRRFQINGAGPRRSDGKLDAEKLKALKAAGWIPYSVRMGGRYYSFTSTPLSVPLAILGNYLDSARFNPREWEQTQALDRAVFALWSSASVFAQMSFIDSAARLMGWVHDGGRPKKMGDNLVEVVGRSAGSIVIPNALRQLDRMQDPTVYDGRGLAGAIAASVPFARRANEVALNAVGEPVAASPWARFASDAKPGIMQELAARGLWIAVPSADDVLPDLGRKLEPAEFHQYVKLSGEMIRKALAEDGQWRRLDAENAQRLVGEHVAESRHRARVLLGFEAPVDLPKAPKPYVPPVRLFGR